MIDIDYIERSITLKEGFFFPENITFKYYSCKETACKRFRSRGFMYVAIPFFENSSILEKYLKGICDSFACKLEIVTISKFEGRLIKYLVAKISEGEKVISTNIGVDFLFLKIKQLFGCVKELDVVNYHGFHVPFGSLFKYDLDLKTNYIYYMLMQHFDINSDTVAEIPLSNFSQLTSYTGLFSFIKEIRVTNFKLYKILYDKFIGNYVLQVNFTGKPEEKERFLMKIDSMTNIHYNKNPNSWTRWKLNGSKVVETNTIDCEVFFNSRTLGYRGQEPYVKKD